jgi:hypothetical protein
MSQFNDEEPSEPASIAREYGPFPGVDAVHGVSFDGSHVWFASGSKLSAFAPVSAELVRELPVAGNAGTAFDGRHLYQLVGDRIQKLDRESGQVLASIPAPAGNDSSGLTWAEGNLWVGQYRSRKIYKLDPETGAILRTIETNRFVTGVTWIDGELWHGTWENEHSELHRIDPQSGRVLARLALPQGQMVSGLESNGSDLFYCGGGKSGKVRAVRRPKSGAR